MVDIVLRCHRNGLTGRADCFPAVLRLGMGKGAVNKVRVHPSAD